MLTSLPHLTTYGLCGEANARHVRVKAAKALYHCTATISAETSKRITPDTEILQGRRFAERNSKECHSSKKHDLSISARETIPT